MKQLHLTWGIVAALVLIGANGARADEDVTNRLTLSARFGFNISAKFKGLTPPPASARTAPDGLPYNYDDGYVHTDISDNFGGQTWNWGYDDSSRQIVGNTIEMSRTTGGGAIPGTSLGTEPGYGAELSFDRPILVKEKLRAGIEAAVNYLNLGFDNRNGFSANLTRVIDAYPFTPGTTPPAATPDNPYQGSFTGPGFVIGTNFTSRAANGATPGTGHRQLDADIWGFRLGPYLEMPLGERLSVSVGAGLALGIVSADASWHESITGGPTFFGRGNDTDLLWGGYVGANVAWRFAKDWSAVGGVQYQNLGDYRHSFGGRQVELELSHSIFVTLGVGYCF